MWANAVAAVGNTGTLRFGVFDEKLTTGMVFENFLRRLVRDALGRRVVLILDGGIAHDIRIAGDRATLHGDLLELHLVRADEPGPDPRDYLEPVLDNGPVEATADDHRRGAALAAA